MLNRQFMWAGYGGTCFWVDPEDDLVAVLMTQRAGRTRAYYRRRLMQLVYQAITNQEAADVEEAALQ